MNNDYNQYFHFDASSIPFRALNKTENVLYAALLVISVPLAGISKIFGLDKESAYPSEMAFLADLARGVTASSFMAREEVANGFARFLDVKFGDLISISTPEKDIYTSNHVKITSSTKAPEDKPYQMRALAFNVQLDEYNFLNSIKFGTVKDGEFDLQNAAIREQLAKVTKLLGGKADEYENYEIFSVADVQAPKFKAQAIEQMRAIDGNVAEIRKEIQKLVSLSKGETLADAIVQKREAAKAHEPVVTTARDALAAARAQPKTAEAAR